MAKILHLLPDEKVTDNIIENFQKVYDNNLFYILGDNKKRIHCKTDQENVIFGNSDLFSIVNVDNDVKAIVVHGLNYPFAKLILQLNLQINVAWFAWGYDVYNLPKLINGLYAPFSRRYLRKDEPKFALVNAIKKLSVPRSLYYKFFTKTEDFYSAYEKAHKRIDFFCSYIREDYDLFMQHYPNKLIYCEIGYFSIDQYLAGQSNLRIKVSAQNILVGNSNSLENNHLDVFNVLQNIPFKGKVIVPLSYGKDENYKKFVLTHGSYTLNDVFFPLLDFMSREDYLSLLSGCSTAVFYHYRQQGMGNILALLYMGVRVYFSDKNPVYHYFTRIGVKVFNFDTEFALYTNRVLENEVQEANRKVLDTIFNEDILQLQYKDLVNRLTNVI